MGVFDLPEGYSEIKRVDFLKNKKLALFINAGALVIMAAMFFLGIFFVPLSFTVDAGQLVPLLLKAAGGLLAIVLYLIAHEWVHGIFIKKFSGKKAKYGFVGLYAYAGTDAYLNKRHYIVVALAPVVLFGVAFLALNLFSPRAWFWGVYLLQIMNLSGAVGDLYITWLMSRLPADVLTNDEGVAMVIYSKTK